MIEEEEFNPFDALGFKDIEETKKLLEEHRTKGEKLDQLIHQVFEQNESGAELLDLWAETLLMMPTANLGDDLLAIGINEGVKQFIRNIKLTVEKVERGEQ
jgi:hypothetical protein